MLCRTVSRLDERSIHVHGVQIDSLQKHASFKSLQQAIEEEERKVDSLHLNFHDSKEVSGGRAK